MLGENYKLFHNIPLKDPEPEKPPKKRRLKKNLDEDGNEIPWVRVGVGPSHGRSGGVKNALQRCLTVSAGRRGRMGKLRRRGGR